MRTAGNDHIFGTGDDLLIPILVARYDATTSSVTLPLRRGIHPPTPFQFTINQSTNVAGAGVGVADVVGNLLDGANNGSPGSPFAIVLSGRTGPYIASQASTRVAAELCMRVPTELCMREPAGSSQGSFGAGSLDHDPGSTPRSQAGTMIHLR